MFSRQLSRIVLFAIIAWGGLGAMRAGSPDAAPRLPEPTAKIMLLGTFHFTDAGRDDYKPKHDVDILSEARQKEVEEVLDGLAGFRPSKIAVEWMPEHQERADQSICST